VPFREALSFCNVLDTITDFHQEGGVWKYWSDHLLGVELVQ
jgi:hypothetical protein